MPKSAEPGTTQNRAKRMTQHPGRVRWHRVAAGLTLEQAAKLVGCSFTHLSGLETGRLGASVPMLARIAAAYGCEIKDLIPDRDAA